MESTQAEQTQLKIVWKSWNLEGNTQNKIEKDKDTLMTGNIDTEGKENPMYT